MTLYYYLTNYKNTYIIGPFITITDTETRYVGQIIRSNDFSDNLNNFQTPQIFNLHSINLHNMNLSQVKIQLQLTLAKYLHHPNTKFEGCFQGIIDNSNLTLEFYKNNKHYLLDFRLVNNIIFCPSLTIINT